MNVVTFKKEVHDHLRGGILYQSNAVANEAKKQRICQLLDQKSAVLIAHYYTDSTVQELAEETNGFIGDSLEMARFGNNHRALTLVVAGVRFMGETAQILSPEKRILMPSLEAECSLDLGCPIDKFSEFCDQNPEREVVVYANTSAAVKARADWVVTSSCALNIIEYLDGEGKKIIWGPDKYLGRYIEKHTGADMLLWDGSCIVHEEFQSRGIADLKQVYPDAAVLVHPESPEGVVEMADVVGSTSSLLRASYELPHQRFIVATDRGIFYKMQQASPNKEFFEAPTAGYGATCKSCGNCPWMAMNSLESLLLCLEKPSTVNEIRVPEDIRRRAIIPLNRMLDFCAK